MSENIHKFRSHIHVQNVEEHSLRHTRDNPTWKPTQGKKTYKCMGWEKQFSRNSSLKLHMQAVHQGMMPFECNICGRRFSEKGVLKHHERTHSGKKPYKYTECGKAFAQNGSLKSHMKNHTGEKPYRMRTIIQTHRQSARSHENPYRWKVLQMQRM